MTAFPAENIDKIYTYADYLTWDNNVRCEIIDGVVYNMAPGPSTNHQSISMNLSVLIGSFLKSKSCRLFSAPFDVRFYKNEEESCIENVVQPDLSIICDKSKIDNKGCKGSPDWIIEILSPSTSKMDLQIKFNLYEKYGVKEYWIVDPNEEFILVFKLIEGKFVNSDRLTKGDNAKTIFEDLEIDLSEVFEGESDFS